MWTGIKKQTKLRPSSIFLSIEPSFIGRWTASLMTFLKKKTMSIGFVVVVFLSATFFDRPFGFRNAESIGGATFIFSFFLIRRSSPGWFRNETTGSIRSTADTSTVDVTVADRKGKKKRRERKRERRPRRPSVRSDREKKKYKTKMKNDFNRIKRHFERCVADQS